MIEELPPGYEVTFASPPGVQGYDDVMTRGLQAVGAATGVPYEEISGDYSKVNFSSARMARAAFHGLVDEYQWQVIIPGFCDRVFAWFLEAARIQGDETANVRMEWTTPRKILVDPAREIPAAIQGARATLTSPQEVVQGTDWRRWLTMRRGKCNSAAVEDRGR
jgi:capsid protein